MCQLHKYLHECNHFSLQPEWCAASLRKKKRALCPDPVEATIACPGVCEMCNTTNDGRPEHTMDDTVPERVESESPRKKAKRSERIGKWLEDVREGSPLHDIRTGSPEKKPAVKQEPEIEQEPEIKQEEFD